MLERKKTQPNTVLFAGCVIFVCLTLLRVFFSGPISSFSYTLARPVWSVRAMLFGSTEDTLTEATASKADLIAKNKLLSQEVYDLQVNNLALTSETLAPHIETTLHQNTVMVKVISKPPLTPYDVFVVDTSARTLPAGSLVYLGDNVLIGTVSQSTSRSALVSLYSSGSLVTPVDVLRTGETIALKGQGGGNFEAILPKDFSISPGDILVDRGATRSVIAQVYSVDESSGGSFKKAYARIPTNIFQAEWLFVSPGTTSGE